MLREYEYVRLFPLVKYYIFHVITFHSDWCQFDSPFRKLIECFMFNFNSITIRDEKCVPDFWMENHQFYNIHVVASLQALKPVALHCNQQIFDDVFGAQRSHALHSKHATQQLPISITFD